MRSNARIQAEKAEHRRKRKAAQRRNEWPGGSTSGTESRSEICTEDYERFMLPNLTPYTGQRHKTKYRNGQAKTILTSNAEDPPSPDFTNAPDREPTLISDENDDEDATAAPAPTTSALNTPKPRRSSPNRRPQESFGERLSQSMKKLNCGASGKKKLETTKKKKRADSSDESSGESSSDSSSSGSSDSLSSLSDSESDDSEIEQGGHGVRAVRAGQGQSGRAIVCQGLSGRVRANKFLSGHHRVCSMFKLKIRELRNCLIDMCSI